MSKPLSRRNIRKPNHSALGLTGALGDDTGDSDNDLGGNLEDNSSRAQRFATNLEGNRFRELEQSRIQERKQAIAQGLIADPNKPTSLENAIEFVGTCTEMCPLFEREEREFKKNVHPLEQKGGQPGRIDPQKAVTMYHRSAAGIDQPLPTDVRTPATLKRTLDYLFYTVMKTQPPDLAEPPTPLTALRYTHGFIRDRTRGIRQDFTYQRHVGILENIECHERIARFHILAIHELGKLEDGQFLKQETEQLNKTLISLIELYDDQRLDGRTCRNEPEFRAYQLLSHLNDNEVARTILDLPNEIFGHPHLQLVFTFRSLAQRNFDTQKVGSKYNAEISLNFFSQYFKRVKKRDVPFLIACLAQTKFGDVRRAGIRALMRAYPAPPQGVVLRPDEDPLSMRAMPVAVFAKLMGCQDEAEAMAIADALGVEPYFPRGIPGLDPNVPLGFLVNTSADFDDNGDAPPAELIPEVEAKRLGSSYQDVIDGKLTSAANVPAPPRSKVEPRARVHSGTTSASSLDQTAFSLRPAPAPAPKATPSPLNLNAAAKPFVPTMSAQALPVFMPSEPRSIQIHQPSSFFPAAGPFERQSQPSMPRSTNDATSAFAFSSQKPWMTATPLQQATSVTPATSAAAVPTLVPASPAISIAGVGSNSQSTSSQTPAKMPTRQIDAMSKGLANKALVAYTEEFVRKTTQHAIDSEHEWRDALEDRLAAARRARLEEKLIDGLLNQMIESVVRDEVADAYGEEIWESPLRLKVFAWWRKSARERRARRLRSTQRSITRDDFSKKVKALTISTIHSANSDAYTSEASRSRNWPAENLDMDVDTNTQLRKLAKRKAILDEGTFFSVLGSHICNASSGNENADYGDEHVSGNVKWDVVLSVTEQPSGTWLKSKFNLTHQSRYTAQYHGDRLDAEVTALIEPATIPETVGLLVFETSADHEEDGERLTRLLSHVPRRPVYQIGLLLVQRLDEDEEWLTQVLPDLEIQPISSIAVLNIARDASDQAFETALGDALPQISYVPHVQVSMEDPATALFKQMQGLLSFADYLLLQNIEDPPTIAEILTSVLHTLEKLQSYLLSGILGAFDVSAEGHALVTFDCERCPTMFSEDDLLSWLQDILNHAAQRTPYLQAARDYFARACQADEETLSSMLSKYLDIVNRSVLEYSSDIQIDITAAELATLPGITEQVCEQFKTECTTARAGLTRFAQVDTHKGRNRRVATVSEEDRSKNEVELASRYAGSPNLDFRLPALIMVANDHSPT
ncbi:hypothetical protein NliqN6_4088 [Naganishia liquefaciens]|uniref:SAC3/GANP/THP3 conserved domain-containing protein n=1 Tax=Naganishia liquefaciens TaxID=104408 RepID=A0A8H3YHJ1_9TREE|nr:hypothetical protein NliqN6_4088 [Naganishia liquefaciens]